MKQYVNPEQGKSKDLQSALDVVCTFKSNYKYLIKEVKFSLKIRPLSVSRDCEWRQPGDRMDTQKWLIQIVATETQTACLKKIPVKIDQEKPCNMVCFFFPFATQNFMKGIQD